MKVQLSLVGDNETVMSVVALALEEGVLHNMEVVDVPDADDLPTFRRGRAGSQIGAKKRFRPQADYAKPFENPGTRVVAKSFHGRNREVQNKLGVQIGDVGTVVSYRLAGNGAKVKVKWDRTGETSEINGSYLNVIRKVSVGERR